jgi:hypothetical protein
MDLSLNMIVSAPALQCMKMGERAVVTTRSWRRPCRYSGPF